MLPTPEVLVLVLAVAALLVGATGTWSPCGFSMIETLGPGGHTGGRPTTMAACATFLPGAVIGALVTFGGLALAGSLLPGNGGAARLAIAAAVAVVAAVLEARGLRIAPQIRRQLPEHWRRVMPMPVAAALYGMLLGLGFTTFVLTFGVWALAGIAFALGEPAAGLAIGLGFGVGRALPVIAVAPISDRPFGRRLLTLMAERPGLYRGVRAADALALLVAALVIGSAHPAIAADITDGERTSGTSPDGQAAGTATEPVTHRPTGESGNPAPDMGVDPDPDTATDPATDSGPDADPEPTTDHNEKPAPDDEDHSPDASSNPAKVGNAANPATDGVGVFAYQHRNRQRSTVVDGGDVLKVKGSSPAVTAQFILVARRNWVQIRERGSGNLVGKFRAKRVDAVAANNNWIAYRTRAGNRDKLFVRNFAIDGIVGPPRRIAKTGKRGQLSRPSVQGNRLAYAVTKPKAGRIVIKGLDGGSKHSVRTSRKILLIAPALGPNHIAYVAGRKSGYELRLRNLDNGSDRRLLKRGRNRPLTGTAIGPSRIYVTELRGRKLRPRIISAKP